MTAVRRVWLAFFLWGCAPLVMSHSQEALYTHCVEHWTAQAAGETCYGWARKHGLSDSGPIGTRTPYAAFVFCRDHFDETLEDISDSVARATICWDLAEQGPPQWR